MLKSVQRVQHTGIAHVSPARKNCFRVSVSNL